MEDNKLEHYQPEAMTLTDAAVDKLKQLLDNEEPGTMFRVFLQGGGCSGFEYGFAFENEQQADDQEFDFDGVKVVVDSMSYMYLAEATIDYKDQLMQSGFVIDNPMATGTCGCGSSVTF
mgnify:CR=1 FL=1